MTKPLALLCHENLMLGNRLAHKLEELGYRVQTEPLSEAAAKARASKPMVFLIDLSSGDPARCEAIRTLRGAPETAHIPVLAFVRPEQSGLQSAALAAGANLVAAADGALAQLPNLLSQALELA